MIKCLWSEIFVGKSRLQFSLPSLIWVISRFEYTNGLDRNKCFFAYIHAFFFPCILCKSIWSCYRQSSSSALSITNIVFNFFQRHRKVLIIKKMISIVKSSIKVDYSLDYRQSRFKVRPVTKTVFISSNGHWKFLKIYKWSALSIKVDTVFITDRVLSKHGR